MLVVPDQWLPGLEEHHGPAVRRDPELSRWTWYHDEWGVYIEQLTHAWQSVAWSPQRSVTLRTVAEPTDDDITAMARLAGLGSGEGR